MQAQRFAPASSLHPDVTLAAPVVQYRWKATFIEEVAPREAGALRRTQSEPLAGPGRAEFADERAYVDALEAEADWLLALPRRPSETQRPSKRRGKTREASASSVSIASVETRCPSPTRGQPGSDVFVYGSELSGEAQAASAPRSFGSEPPAVSMACFLSEAHVAWVPVAFSSEPPAAPVARFGSERPKAPTKSKPLTAPVRAGARPFCSEPPAPVSQGPVGSVGSLGHPQLCNRPCLQFSRGECPSGAACRFCHQPHGGRGNRTPHLDKRHREQLGSLPFACRAAIALPIMERQVERLGVQADADWLLRALQEVASPAPRDPRTRREGMSLVSALGALSYHSLLTVICKAPDTPEWLAKGAVEEHIQCIRVAEQRQLQGSRRG